MNPITITIRGLTKFHPTLWDEFVVPDGVDATLAIANIITYCSPFELLSPDGDYMQVQIGQWCRTNMDVWDRLYKTTTLDYNPIENYDRQEDLQTYGTSNNQATNDSYTAAYNAPQMVNQGQNKNSSAGSTTSKSTNRLHGNIGVTTTQEMIKQEREVASYSVYETIWKSFRDTFCIRVY
jgi:hypothetical protein